MYNAIFFLICGALIFLIKQVDFDRIYLYVTSDVDVISLFVFRRDTRPAITKAPTSCRSHNSPTQRSMLADKVTRTSRTICPSWEEKIVKFRTSSSICRRPFPTIRFPRGKQIFITRIIPLLLLSRLVSFPFVSYFDKGRRTILCVINHCTRISGSPCLAKSFCWQSICLGTESFGDGTRERERKKKQRDFEFETLGFLIICILILLSFTCFLAICIAHV